MSTFDLSAADVRTSLTETISWCVFRPISARLTETPELLIFRTLLSQAGDLYRRVYASLDQKVSRDYTKITKTAEWNAAQELNRKAFQYSFPLMAQELRSPELKPEVSLSDCESRCHRDSIVRSVIAKRAVILRSDGWVSAPGITADLGGGRLLLFVPDETLSDGAAAVESNWFFDDDNVPPWDTWVAFMEGTLFSWVPPQLVPLVQKGIVANPEECIRWLDG